MTVELVIAIPVLIAVAVIAVNATTFFAKCAVFDRVACEAVRVHASAPAYGQETDMSVSLVEQSIKTQLNDDNLEISVEHGVTGVDFDEFRMKLTYSPTLFSHGLRSHVFGVSLPRLTHEVRYVVDAYKPGVIV